MAMCQQCKGCGLVSRKDLFSLFPWENNGIMFSAWLLRLAHTETLYYEGQMQEKKGMRS